MFDYLERQRVEVRADHLENGDIIPLGYKDPHGQSQRIDRILLSKKEITISSDTNIRFYCRTANEITILLYTQSGWLLEQ